MLLSVVVWRVLFVVSCVMRVMCCLLVRFVSFVDRWLMSIACCVLFFFVFDVRRKVIAGCLRVGGWLLVAARYFVYRLAFVPRSSLRIVCCALIVVWRVFVLLCSLCVLCYLLLVFVVCHCDSLFDLLVVCCALCFVRCALCVVRCSVRVVRWLLGVVRCLMFVLFCSVLFVAWCLLRVALCSLFRCSLLVVCCVSVDGCLSLVPVSWSLVID